MYDVYDYGRMIADHARVDAYAQALRQVIRPGVVVADIGSGTGIFALLACRFGARRVYAIEPDDAIIVAQECAAANGYADRLECLQLRSTQVILPEKADVIVSELHGMLPLFQHHLPAIVDARQRLLAADGVLIPQRETLWAALIEAPQLYNDYVAPWTEDRHGVNLQPGQRFVINTLRKGRFVPTQYLAEPKCWATLDYTVLESPDITGTMTWTVERKGTLHGLSVWFDATLVEGVTFSNAPDKPEMIYGRAFFPLAEPVSLECGDRVAVTIQAKLVEENYVWAWTTDVFERGEQEHSKAHFTQSTFAGVPLSPQRLRKQAADYIPVLNKEGQVAKFILESMSTGQVLEDIAQRAVARFPERFANRQQALSYVGKLSHKYSQ